MGTRLRLTVRLIRGVSLGITVRLVPEVQFHTTETQIDRSRTIECRDVGSNPVRASTMAR